jgi:hypothetical protein
VNHVAQIPSPPKPVADCPARRRHWHPRFVTCAVCLRPAQGFGFFNPNTRRPREHRWFCSMPCQAWFAARKKKGLTMQGMTEEEHLAVAGVMRRLGIAMDEIGWNKRLRELNAAEVTFLIGEVLEGYGTEMSRIAAKGEVPF